MKKVLFILTLCAMLFIFCGILQAATLNLKATWTANLNKGVFFHIQHDRIYDDVVCQDLLDHPIFYKGDTFSNSNGHILLRHVDGVL